MFGKAYPDHVGVVSPSVDNSVEFYGETHILNIAKAESFIIIEDISIAKTYYFCYKEIVLKFIEEWNCFKDTVSESEKQSTDTSDLDKIAVVIRKNLDSSELLAVAKAELRFRLGSF